MFKDDHQTFQGCHFGESTVVLRRSTLESSYPHPQPHRFHRFLRLTIQVANSGNGPHNYCLTYIASGMSTIHMTPDFMIFHPVKHTYGPKFLCLPGGQKPNGIFLTVWGEGSFWEKGDLWLRFKRMVEKI